MQKGRRCSALQVDRTHPLCAAMSPEGGGIAELDAVAEVWEALGEDEGAARSKELKNVLKRRRSGVTGLLILRPAL